MCVCVRLVKTEMRKTEVRVYAVSISEPPGAGPQLGRKTALPFLWTSTLCLVGLDWGWRADSLSPQHPSCTPLLSVGMKYKLLSQFAGMASYGDTAHTHGVFKDKLKQEKDYQGDGSASTVSVGCPHAQVCSRLPLPTCGVPWQPNPVRLTLGQPGPWLHLHGGITQRPPGNKCPEGRLHYFAVLFLMLHLPCGTLLSLTACKVWCGFSFHITLAYLVL